MLRSAVVFLLFAGFSCGCDNSGKARTAPAIASSPAAESGGAPSEAAAPPEFDGARALKELTELAEFGHRYYGAPKRDQALDRLESRLNGLTDQVERQPFKVTESVSGVEYELVNLVGRLRPDLARRVILGSHFDTRLWAEEESDSSLREQPIMGANDGTSGVALLFELLEVAGAHPALEEIGLDVVLFDGEEFGRPGNQEYSQGAEFFASKLPSLYPQGPAEAAIVLDMVADADLRIRRETISERNAKWLNDLIWRHGKNRNSDVFVDSFTGSILDDHGPLQKAGIPAVLVIDLEYPPWHTQSDTPDKCSAESLQLVGTVLIDVLTEIAKKGAL